MRLCPFPRGRHHRLDERGEADATGNCRAQFLERRAERIPRRRQAALLRGEAADAFAVHGDVRGVRRRDHAGEAFRFDAHQLIRRDRLDLRHDEMRALLENEIAHGFGVGHVDHVRAVSNLLARRIGVAVDGDRLDAEALQLDDDFLAELAAPRNMTLVADGESGVPMRIWSVLPAVEGARRTFPKRVRQVGKRGFCTWRRGVIAAPRALRALAGSTFCVMAGSLCRPSILQRAPSLRNHGCRDHGPAMTIEKHCVQGSEFFSPWRAPPGDKVPETRRLPPFTPGISPVYG